MRTPFIPIIGVMVLLAAAGIYRMTVSATARNRIETLRDSVQELRAASDTCAMGLQAQQSALLEFRTRLDALHADVRGFEEAELGGVPQERYSEYMTQFAQYRDSAAAWEGRVGSVESRLAACQQLAREHNTAVDSLRAALH